MIKRIELNLAHFIDGLDRPASIQLSPCGVLVAGVNKVLFILDGVFSKFYFLLNTIIC